MKKYLFFCLCVTTHVFGYYYVNRWDERCKDGSLPIEERDSSGVSWYCEDAPSTGCTWYKERLFLNHAQDKCPPLYEKLYYQLEKEYWCERWVCGSGNGNFPYVYVARYAPCPKAFPHGPFVEKNPESGVSYYCTR